MSLYVRVWDCRPSVLATAFARLVAGPLPAGGWDDLDRENFLEKGLSQSSRGGLRNEYEEAYFADRAEAANWDKVLRAMPGSPQERYQIDARRFAVAGRRACLSRMKATEACRAFSASMEAFIERQFGDGKHAYPAFIPGECMRICVRSRPIFLDLLPLPWTKDVPVGLRCASHGEAAQFLRLLGGLTEIRLVGAEGCRCEVAREGTRVSIPELHGLIGGGQPERCLELLEKASGREVAKSEFPPYDKEGRPIPE